MNAFLYRMTCSLLIAWAVGSTISAAAQDQLIVQITCRGGAVANLDPNQIDSLVLRSRGRRVEWVLRTAGCPTALKRVEIKFANTSPFGQETADRELVVPDLPEPLPESFSLATREIVNAGVHNYEVLFWDADRNLLGTKEGRVSARVLAPALSTTGLLTAGLGGALLFWLLRRRLFANSASM